MKSKTEGAMPDRETQARVIEQTEERVQSYLDRWMANPAFRVALHAHDEEVRPTPRKVAGAR